MGWMNSQGRGIFRATAKASKVEALGSSCSDSNDSSRAGAIPARCAKACSEHF